jgi:carboxypeptidase family protein
VSNAAIAQAKIVATNQDTNFSRETATNSSGEYSLTDLPPGPYTLTVSAPGFQTSKRTGVVVTVQTVTRANVSLGIGQLTET